MKILETRIPPPLLVLLFGFFMWLVVRNSVESWRLYLTAGLALIAVCLFASALMAFRSAQTTVNPHHPDKTSTLVTSGVFRISRNPIYLAMLLILIAWGVWLGNPTALLLSAGFVGYMNRFQIAPEERALQDNFGDEFLRYRQQVRRWL